MYGGESPHTASTNSKHLFQAPFVFPDVMLAVGTVQSVGCSGIGWMTKFTPCVPRRKA